MAGAGEPAQHPSAHLLLHRGEVFRVSARRPRRSGPARPRPPQTPRRSRSSGSGHGHSTRCRSAVRSSPPPAARAAQPLRWRSRASITRNRMCSTAPSASGSRLQEVAQALGHRQHPLAHRQRREDLVDQMGGRLGHAPRVAGGTHAAAFAGKRDQEIVPALPAAGTGEAVGQNAAFEVAAKLPLHVLRHAVRRRCARRGRAPGRSPDGPAPRGTVVCARGGAGGRRCSGPGSRPRGPCDSCIRLVTAG